MKGRNWLIWTISATAVIVGAIALLTYIIDPYFHYHKPVKGITYRIYEERFVNDGILRNFEYDSIIIGTSMTQNFKTTEFERLLGGTAVKTPLAGAGYQEISNTLQRAFDYNADIRQVLWGIDYGYLLEPYDFTLYSDFPEYLYDNKILNDVNYLLSKDVLVHQTLYSIVATLTGENTTSFDEYSAWVRPSGKDVVMNTYIRSGETHENQELSESEREQIVKTVTENIIAVTEQHPDTTFYLFYTPYSIAYWDRESRYGNLIKQIQADEIATKMLVECDNVKLYSFFLEEDLVMNLDEYTDVAHYTSNINTYILEQISKDANLITKDNYEGYIAAMKNFYLEFDYEKLIQENTEEE